MERTFAAVDYGSKLAGTTVWIHREPDGQFCVFQSAPKKDADHMLLELAEKYRPARIFLDAPLSLPAVYGMADKPEDADYFYRHCDRQAGAMSPMFLGGLTARAMQLRASFQQRNIQTHEVYPGKLARLLDLPDIGYKKKAEHLPAVKERLLGELPAPPLLPPDIHNWHQVDALLAWLSGWRFLQNSHHAFGDPQEGVIIV